MPAATNSSSASRVMVVWCPDWPVIAQCADLPAGTAAAVVQDGQVLACSPAARSEGVCRGMRQRDAQATCPELVLRDHSPDADARVFEDVIAVIESLTTGVALMRPGLCALTVSPRYYGGEREAAAVIAERLVEHGIWDVRCGIADELFTAEQAARKALPQDSMVISKSGSTTFLAELPIDVLGDEELASVLRRLGIRRLGEFAQLSSSDVHTRFGPHGGLLHRLAQGTDPRPVAARALAPELDGALHLEPPLDRVDAVAFSARTMLEGFVERLARHGVVATAIRLEVDSDGILASSRLWRHPRWFSSTDLVDRLRWQLQGSTADEHIQAPIDAVRVTAEVLESMADHADGLFGGGPDSQIVAGVARVQSIVGPEAVQSAHLQGGRSPRDRQATAMWGDQPQLTRAPDQPWPGAIPLPAPAVVFHDLVDALVVGAAGQPITVSERGAVRGIPTRFRTSADAALQPVASWAGPWPIDEHWWDEASARRIARFQVVGVDGSAWLMVVENGQWWTEARYD